jgi:uncharacterized protein
MSWQARLRSTVPSREQLLANRWLRWLAPHLSHPRLWHWSRRGVALGVALGVFFGFLIPVAQIPLTAVSAVILRANLPVAAASTLVTNPVTFAPVYYFAYQLGGWLTGEGTLPEAVVQERQEAKADQSIWERIQGVGKPLLVGLVTLAIFSGLLVYALISLIWRWRIVKRWQARQSRSDQIN